MGAGTGWASAVGVQSGACIVERYGRDVDDGCAIRAFGTI